MINSAINSIEVASSIEGLGGGGGGGSGVPSVNSIAGDVTIAGAGLSIVSTAGSTITISGSGQDLSSYASSVNLFNTGFSLQSQINNLNSNTGNYYNNNNPSGFLINSNLTNASGQISTNLFNTGSNLQNQITGKAPISHTHQSSDILGDIVYSNNGTNYNWSNGLIQTQVISGDHAPTFSNWTSGKAHVAILSSSGATRTVTVPSTHFAESATFTIASGSTRYISIVFNGAFYYWAWSAEIAAV